MAVSNAIGVAFWFFSITQWSLQGIYGHQCGKWDYNWDYPHNQTRAGGTRNLIMIRHGQYNYGQNELERYLTDLGQMQVAVTANYLKSLGVKFDKIVTSTMTRALVTANIISALFPELKIVEEPLLTEGFFIRPDPPAKSQHTEEEIFHSHNRIEVAFRKYFFRGAPDQKGDTYTLLVNHGNVIRYLMCRALQIPLEAWLRISLAHASITWLTIGPTGKVSLRSLGEGSHIPREMQSR